jgi:hypothetical protein
MRYALAFLLLTARLWAAPGDYLGAQINAEGWRLWIDFESMPGTNGTFSFGLGTNGSLTGLEKCVLTLTGPGPNSAGNYEPVTRQLCGTFPIYLPYPGNAFPDIAVNGTTTTVKIALEDYVYSSETNITITLKSGLYTSNIVSGACVNMPVTNSSGYAAPQPVAVWLSKPFNLISANTMKLRAMAFDRDGCDGKPVGLMRFVVRDQHNIGTTNFVTRMNRWVLPLTGLTISTYEADMDLSGMTQGDDLRCDYTAYSLYGTATLDTMDGVNLVGPYYAPITNVCDRLGTYGRAYAAISTAGSDASGVVSSNTVTTWVSPFLNMNTAFNAIVKSNVIWHGASRSNHANSTLYLASDISYMGNGNNTAVGTPYPTVAMRIANYPTNAQWAFGITNGGGGEDRHCKRLVCDGINIASVSATLGLYSSWDYLFLTNCLISHRPALVNQTCTNLYMQSCLISNVASASFLAAADVCPTLLLDILDITTNGYVSKPHNLVGYARTNAMTANAAGQMIHWEVPSTRTPMFNRGICAFNDFRGWRGTAAPINIFDNATCTNGYAFVGNLCEMFAGNINLAGVHASSTFDATNGVIWGNTFVGNRVLMDYNWNGSAAKYRVLMTRKNNFYDWVSIKSDTTAPYVAAQTGNWAVVYGVGRKGEINAGTTNRYNTPVAHSVRFGGIGSIEVYSLATNWFQFSAPKSLSASDGVGMGDYRVLSSSPALRNGVQTEYIVPWSITGNALGALGSGGGVGAASPRKGFF